MCIVPRFDPIPNVELKSRSTVLSTNGRHEHVYILRYELIKLNSYNVCLRLDNEGHKKINGNIHIPILAANQMHL